MDKKRKLFRVIENYINISNKNEIEEFYGKGSYIRIHNITPSYSQKILLFEIVIILGETISEELMEDEMADVLVQESSTFFFPEFRAKSLCRWDV